MGDVDAKKLTKMIFSDMATLNLYKEKKSRVYNFLKTTNCGVGIWIVRNVSDARFKKKSRLIYKWIKNRDWD